MNTNAQKPPAGIPGENVLDLRTAVRPVPEPVARRVPKARTRQPGRYLKSALSRVQAQVRRIDFSNVQLPRRRINRPRPAWVSVGIFSIVALLLVSPLIALPTLNRLKIVRADVLAASTDAYGHLRTAGDHVALFELDAANQEFSSALDAFQNAETSLNSAHGSLWTMARAFPLTGGLVRSAEGLVTAGQEFSRAGQLFSETMNMLSGTSVDANTNTTGATIAIAASSLQANIQAMSEHLKAAAGGLAAVRPKDVPGQYRDTLQTIQAQLPIVKSTLDRTETIADVVGNVLGADQERQILLVFQNNDELRATGGFLGSFALVAIRDGNIRVVEVPGRGFLDLDFAGMPKRRPPDPLQLINTLWQAQDGNWWPDFPASAEVLRGFYAQSRGYDVDGVVAVTPELVESLLRLTGPINLEEYHLNLDAQSFRRELQTSVEETYDRTLNQPKQVIGALMPKLLSAVISLPPSRLIETGGVLAKAITHRDVLVNFADSGVQSRIRELGWAGEVRSSLGDYLMVVDTNVGGGKTDGVMSESIDHSVAIGSDGIATVTLRIRREHHGDPDDYWTKVTNVDYLRVYVPDGSSLQSATGFSSIGRDRFLPVDPGAATDPAVERLEGELSVDRKSGTVISRQFGKTVFANWLEVPVNESREAVLTYTIPLRFAGRQFQYSLLAQAQPGAQNRRLRSTLSFQDAVEPAWLTPSDSSLYRLGQSITFSAMLDQDRTYAAVFEPK